MSCQNYIISIFVIFFKISIFDVGNKMQFFSNKQKFIIHRKSSYNQAEHNKIIYHGHKLLFSFINGSFNDFIDNTNYQTCHTKHIPISAIFNNYDVKKLTTSFLKRELPVEDSSHFKMMINKLDSIYLRDQYYRKLLIQKQKEISDTSIAILQLFKIINVNDSLNLIVVSELLDKYGWLGETDIGSQRSKTIFLVIQHSNIKTQVKYLPLLKLAVKNKKVNPHQLCLLEDRISISKNGKQIYGTQIGRNPYTGEYYILPIKNPKRLIHRRNQLGLIDYQEYLSFWALKWDIKEYYKKLRLQNVNTKK